MPLRDQMPSVFLLPSSECGILCPGFGSKRPATGPDIIPSSNSVQREVNFSLYISFSPGGKLVPKALLQTPPHTSLAGTCPSRNNHWQRGIEWLLLAHINRDSSLSAGEGHTFPGTWTNSRSYWETKRLKCLLGSKPEGSPLTLWYIHLCVYMQVYSQVKVLAIDLLGQKSLLKMWIDISG